MDTEGLDYIRISDCDHWCVGMRPDDSLAEKEFIRKEDLTKVSKNSPSSTGGRGIAEKRKKERLFCGAKCGIL